MPSHISSRLTAVAATAVLAAIGGAGYATAQAGATGQPHAAAAAAKKKATCPLKASMCSAIDREVAAYLSHHPGAAGKSGAKGATGAAGAQGMQGVQGAQGTQGAAGQSDIPGPVGPTGATGAQAVSAFSGRIGLVSDTPAGNSGVTQYGAPAGLSSPNGTEVDVQTLSPSTEMVVSGFDAFEDGGAVPAHDSITLHLDVNGGEALACVIPAGQSACDGVQASVQVPPGSFLSIRIDSDATLGTTIPSFNLLFGFEATT